MPTVEVRTQLVPYPLVGVISPWNAPMMLALLDAVPALFAGCAVLLEAERGDAALHRAAVRDACAKCPSWRRCSIT